MLDNFIYENHLGQRFVGLSNNVYLNYNDLRDYSWNYETINNRISRLYRPIKDRKIPLWVHCDSEAEAIEVKNKLCDYAEADIEAKRYGKVYIGDWYTTGYITSSVKGEYLIHKKMCKIELTLTSDNSAWYKETGYRFFKDSGVEVGGLDYPYDYAYGYASALYSKLISHASVSSLEFKLLIYGAVTNPTLDIAGHTYSVDGTIGNGESLMIDSLQKTVTLTTAEGETVNWFDNRSRESNVFEPIRPGQIPINWNDSFGFDLTIIEKRSEPRWT